MGYSFFAQYNTIVALAVPGGILRLILTVLATWSVLSLYATPSHKISIFCPFAQWIGNGGCSLLLLGVCDYHKDSRPWIGCCYQL